MFVANLEQHMQPCGLFPGVRFLTPSLEQSLIDNLKTNPSFIKQMNGQEVDALIEALQKRLASGQRETWHIQLLLVCLDSRKRWLELISLCTDELDRDPHDSKMRFFRALAYFETRDWTAFIGDCHRLFHISTPIEFLKKRCLGHFMIGAAQPMLHDMRKICESLHLPALDRDVDPSNIHAYVRSYEILYTCFPHECEVLRSLAYCHQSLQNWNALLHVCETWQKAIAPVTVPELTKLKTEALMRQRSQNEVAYCTQQWNATHDPQWLRNRAFVHNRNGNLLEALRDLCDHTNHSTPRL